MRNAVPFRLGEAERAVVRRAFAARPEIDWFGFDPSFEGDQATIAFRDIHPGHLGGGSGAALNGGVIAAGFDAACVLTGLGHYETPSVVTVSLSVQFVALAVAAALPRFEAWAVASSRHLLVVEAALTAGDKRFASATVVLKPVWPARGSSPGRGES